MFDQSTSDVYKNIVERIFKIDDITTGDQKDGFLVRYRGMLRADNSEQAYDQLAGLMRPYNITPLFRKENGRHVILLVDGVITPKASNPWVNLILFLLTVLSVMVTGAMYGMEQPFSQNIIQSVINVFEKGWPFTVSMLGILAAHEFGHYLMGRYHKVQVTLPYFIPFPFSPLGTLGAFINMKEIPRNKRHLLDIGLAGPLAGLAVAIPVLFIGLKLSTLNTLSSTIPQGQALQMEGNSILYLAMKFIAFNRLLPEPATWNGLNPILYWIKYFFTGLPFPQGGVDVMLHSVAWAGWAGLLVTALNLIPAGQLDGGHVVYVLLGKERTLKLRPVILILLIVMGFFWTGWWLWAAIVFFLGRYHAEPLDQITELDTKRKWLAAFALLVFVLVFTPIPLSAVG
jgi:membrane-associated protease RseP (regulator of RpoE activity)